jgi:hypothetical protein
MQPGMIMTLKPQLLPCTPSSIFDKPFNWKKIVNTTPAAKYAAIAIKKTEMIVVSILVLNKE